MVIEKFTNRLLASRLIDTYVATAFFATLIYFTLNAYLYTPIEIISSVIIVTIAFKGLGHFVIAMIISLHSLDDKKNEVEFNERSSEIEGLLNDLALQQTKIKTNTE
jgi:hypothetical protein